MTKVSEFTRHHLFTLLAVLLAAAVLLGVDQIRNVMATQLPSVYDLWPCPAEMALGLGFWVFVTGLMFFYPLAVVAVVPVAARRWPYVRLLLAGQFVFWALLVPQFGLALGFVGTALVLVGSVGRWPGWAALPRDAAPWPPAPGRAAPRVSGWEAGVEPFVRMAEAARAGGLRRLRFAALAVMVGGLTAAVVGGFLVAAVTWIDLQGWEKEETRASPMLAYGALAYFTGLWFRRTTLPQVGPPGRLTWGQNMLGRALFLLVLTNLVAQLIWFLAGAWPAVASYRNYTDFMVVHLLLFAVLLARVADAAHSRLGMPVRSLVPPVALAAVLGLGLLSSHSDSGWPAPRVGGEVEIEPNLEQLTATWFTTLERRLEKMPPGQPVLVIAASGGGSRAALYAALVLEELRLQPAGLVLGSSAGPQRRLADNILVLSGVSGGSLASAYHFNRDVATSVYPMRVKDPEVAEKVDPQRPRWRHSIRLEVFKRLHELALAENDKAQKRAATNGGDSAAKDQVAVTARVEDLCRRLLKAVDCQRENTLKPHEPAWLLESAFADDMCCDFMAPLLRGMLLPGQERGESLTDFWEKRFGWEGMNNRGCYDPSPGNSRGYSGEGGRVPPLLLLNTTDVDDGARLVVGFPPLPPGLLGQRLDVRRPELENSALELMDFSGRYRVSLAQAVRLSANFPYGLETAVIRRASPTNRAARLLPSHSDWNEDTGEVTSRPLLDPDPAPPANRLFVSDGGVIDNTGIATLAQLFGRLEFLGDPDGTHRSLERFLQRLDADPLGKRDPVLRKRLGERAERIRARARAVVKDLHQRGVLFIEIDSGAKPSPQRDWKTSLLPSLFEPLRAMNNAAYTNEFLAKTDKLDHLRDVPSGKAAIRYVSCVCNRSHDGSQDVMTAWALGPQDKANVFYEFLSARASIREQIEYGLKALMQKGNARALKEFQQKREEGRRMDQERQQLRLMPPEH